MEPVFLKLKIKKYKIQKNPQILKSKIQNFKIKKTKKTKIKNLAWCNV